MEVVILNPNHRPYTFLLDCSDMLDTPVVILRLKWVTKFIPGATKHIIGGDLGIYLGLDDLDAFARALWEVLAGSEGTSAKVEMAAGNIWQLNWKNDGVDLSFADPTIIEIPLPLTLSIADASALFGDIAVARQAAQDYIESNDEAAAILMRVRDSTERANGRLSNNEKTIPSSKGMAVSKGKHVESSRTDYSSLSKNTSDCAGGAQKEQPAGAVDLHLPNISSGVDEDSWEKFEQEIHEIARLAHRGELKDEPLSDEEIDQMLADLN
jgi:hypothetical protein